VDHLPFEISHHPAVEAPKSDRAHLAGPIQGAQPPGREHAGWNGSATGLAPFIAGDPGALIEPQDVLRGAIEVCPFAIVVVDPAGRIVLANDELERMFGYARGELIGQEIEILVPADLRDRHAAHRGQFAARSETRPAKDRIVSGRRKDGAESRPRWGSRRSSPATAPWPSA
jgi:PAS domain S-box-containing protein